MRYTFLSTRENSSLLSRPRQATAKLSTTTAHIELADDGSFKVLNPQLMGRFSSEAGGQLSAHFV